jgi:hypothetical protein
MVKELFLYLSLVSVLHPAAWTKIEPADTILPPGRYGHSSCYLPDQNGIFIYAGCDGSKAYLGDAWIFYLDSLVWRNATPPTQNPRPRNFPAVCYMASMGKIFMFGGREGDDPPVPYNDTWYYDLAVMAWESVAVGVSPRPRNSPGCAYDPLGNRVVIFGGWSPSYAWYPFLDDLWLFYPDSESWDSVPKTTPWPRGRATGTLVYDPLEHRMILFGGIYFDTVSQQYKLLRDSWALDLATLAWDSLEVTNLQFVPPYYDHGAVFDAPRNRMLVYGGGASQSDEVWSLDMVEMNWQKVPTPGPTPGEWRMAPWVADTACKFAYLFSGQPTNPPPQDLWTFDMSITGISENTPDKPGLSLSVSPNPAKGQVRISLSEEGAYSLRLYDAAGRMVRELGQEQKGGQPERVTLTSFVWVPDVPSGIYFLRLEAGGKALTEKLVIK